MIAIGAVLSNLATPVFRALSALLLAIILLGGCVVPRLPPIDRADAPPDTSGYFTMTDGTRLPYRAWMPDGAPRAVVLALHGMNDSRDAWEYPAPDFAQAGIAVFSPDQRGFGTTPDRGLWAGSREMADDARQMAQLLRARYPHTKLILMGESMGAAVLMVLAAEQHAPPADGYVLIAPAVWGRAEMNIFLRAGLWLFSTTVPDMTATGGGFVHVRASDNFAAIRRLSDDPLTIHATRWDTIRGLVDLMDAALAAAPRFHGPALFLYGGHDELIPQKATAATWRALPPGEREAYYPAGYHLLMRDHERVTPIEDTIAWILHPDVPLPSGADRAAAAWLAKQP
ncbi:MAG TPA: alpha/beta fold hydrolase [Rhodopila sp.]|jgi:alpha-beta hydrolase superfamily lysophospholipase